MSTIGLNKLGTGSGYVYITDVDGNIVSSIPNTRNVAEVIRKDGLIRAPFSSEMRARSTVSLTSGAGTITNITVDGVSVFDTSSAITGASTADLASNARDAINAYISSPNYTAYASGSDFIISAIDGVGESANGFAVTVTTTGTLTASYTNMEGGTDPNSLVDKLSGRRYFINEAAAAPIDSTVGAIEITANVVKRGLESTFDYQELTIASGELKPSRNSVITNVIVDTEGAAASDDLRSIDGTEFENGDILIIRGKLAAQVTTVKDYVSGSDNIELADNADFVSDEYDTVLGLQFFNVNGGRWYEMFRAPNIGLTVANLRSASIPQPVSGTTSTALTAGGGTINLTPGTSAGYQVITGSVTLSSSWTIQGAGSPIDGDTFFVDYRGTITASGNNITIFGISLTDTQILEGRVIVKATYDSTLGGYRAVLLYSADAKDLVDTVALATKEASLGNPAADGYVLSSTTAGVRSWAPAAVDSFLATDTATNATTAVTTEEDLAVYSMPANTLTATGQVLKVQAFGKTAANANAKTIRVKLGTTTLKSNTVETSPNNLDWKLEVEVVRISDTVQKVFGSIQFAGTAVDIDYTTAAEDLTTSLDVKVTGQNGVASASDIECEFFGVKKIG
jgi:hypothetical protein